MQTALILIDVQESFRQRPYWDEGAAPAFFARVNALVEGCRARGVPIVRVLHSDGPAAPDNPFALESGLVVPMRELVPFDAALTVLKHRHSALVGTMLPVWLHGQGVRRLVVAGIRTEQCCETTTRHASDEGWTVDFVAEATLSFDMQHLDGTPLPAAAIVARTCAVLKDRFARIASVGQALADAA